MLDICFVFCDIQREILDYFENNHESGETETGSTCELQSKIENNHKTDMNAKI